MDMTRTVVLYGDSMLLSLVSASLMQCNNIQVIQSSLWEEIESMPEDCIPDVLIYDLPAASVGSILPLLFKNPCLLLIGLDVETNRAVLIEGKETRFLTLDLVKDMVLSD
jgi:hypothetical protein